ncbi:MAG: glycoside hydrolase family 2 protein, partial [Polyangiaceae bacterium]|nr:glycoside hydrolase family 2 protein [Polyangiaceae bacterium]
MFLSHAIDVTESLCAENELAIRFRALGGALRERRPRPRWPTRLISEKNLRFFRTTILGYVPGFAPAIRPVGPFRAVSLVEQRDLAVERARVIPRCEGETCTLEVSLSIRSLLGAPLAAKLALCGSAGHAELVIDRPDENGVFTLRGSASAEGLERWWPHTHGAPALHTPRIELELEHGAGRIELERVGFRTVEPLGVDEGGFGLRVNGRTIFCRGACWTPLDIASLHSNEVGYRRVLEQVRDAGMNMLRVPGTTNYESDLFYRACDELGILVFQDFMFANSDYPGEDPAFAASVKREAEQLLERIGPRPSLAVLCGGSEVEQQAAMMGLPREVWESGPHRSILAEVSAHEAPHVPYVPSSPTGGAMPFHTSEGLCHYYGVGAYLRPVEDARYHRVRFASECLALSNVPEEASLREWLAEEIAPAHHPRFKERVPRDPGAGWDFSDVTDHYVEQLFRVDARRVRYSDHERYLALSRAASAEVMARVQELFRAKSSG